MLEYAAFIYPLCHDPGLSLSRLFISFFLFLTQPRSFDFIFFFFFLQTPQMSWAYTVLTAILY